MSSFSWLSYSEDERERTRDLISRFSDRDTRDELGIGRIRDAFADLLFPGTTTIQTRASYFLFVPWIYKDLEEKKVSSADIKQRARRYEVRLIDSLLDGGNPDGVIGRYAKADLQRLPSNIYWNGLGEWEIRQFSGSQTEYHDSLDVYYELKDQSRDKTGAADGPRPNWHPGLPDPPEDFPNTASLKLRQEDAKYLQDRILQSVPDSMLAEIMRDSQLGGDPDFPWEYPNLGRLSAEVQEILQHSRNFSESMHGAALLYNLMLARKSDDTELIEKYSNELTNWSEMVAARLTELRAWDRKRFWEIVTEASANSPIRMQRFVNQWIDIATDTPSEIAEEETALQLIKQREGRLKGGRARLHNRSALEQWGGEAGTGQLDFRWGIAKNHIEDIFAGLEAT